MIHTPSVQMQGKTKECHKINVPKKKRANELESPKSVTWLGNWEPDRKYVKTIRLKNTSLRILKVKFTSPLTKIFSTPYPLQTIELAAGSSKELQITFRPTESIPYQDQITLTTKDSEYVITLQATIPKPKIDFPNSIEFEPCAIGDVKCTKFTAHNKSYVQTKFKWFAHPVEFSVTPGEGVMGPQAKEAFELKFKPNKISYFKGLLECRFGPELEYSRTTNLEAQSQFPQIFVKKGDKYVNEVDVDFGIVEGGAVGKRNVCLHNLSNVRARFQLKETKITQVGSEFVCQIKSAEIPPNSTFELPIAYSPFLVDDIKSKTTIFITDVFCQDINFATIHCSGLSPKPKITLSEQIIDFGMVLAWTATSRKVHNHQMRIRNDSPVTANFQFLVDCDFSAWNINPKHGCLKPGTSMSVTISFEPGDAAPFFRKVPILIDGADPVFLTLSGSAYNSKQKPAHLSVSHIKRKISARVEKIDPEQRQDLYEEGEIINENNELKFRDEGTIQSSLLGYEQFFEDDVMAVPTISLSKNSLSFNRCSSNGTIHSQHVQVTNHTEGEIIAKWYDSKLKHYFSVHPHIEKIGPGSSFIFTVRFQLSTDQESVFGGEIELNCFYSIMMDYSKLKTEFISPGWSKTLNVTANTFSVTSEAFPSCIRTPNLIICPSTLTHLPTYRTLLINSESNLPVTFKFEDASYQVYPSVGIITSADQFQIVILRAIEAAGEAIGKMKGVFNDDKRYNRNISIKTLGGKPQLTYPREFYFQPTLLGGVIEKEFIIENSSRLPINYEWYINEPNISIQPKNGLISPLDHAKFSVKLYPKEERKYLLKPKLNYLCNGSQTEQLTVRCIGEGVIGQICSERSFVDFGSIMVNKEKLEKLTLINKSNCFVNTKLSIVQNTNNAGHLFSTYLRIENCQSVEISELTLGPRCSKTIYLSLNCPTDGNYSWDIFYEIMKTTRQKMKLLCHVTAEICYPILKLSHISCSEMIPKQLLYELTNVKRLDEILSSTPEDFNTSSKEELENEEMVNINFNSAVQSSAPFIIRMEIVNPGNTEAKFKFLFPADFRMDLEGWAQHSTLSQDQYEIIKIEDNKLFQINPRQGVLKSNERIIIKMIYSYTKIGSHSFPVIMSIDGGRQIPLLLSGVTLSESQNYLNFPLEHHKLTPVQLGVLQVPTQQITFYNGSKNRIHYEIDLKNVDAINEENWDWIIFKVLNPKGVVEPNSCGEILVQFSPLEAKEYCLDLKIKIVGDQHQVMCIIGHGVGVDHVPAPIFLNDKTQIEERGSLCSLSVDRINLGTIPLGSPLRRIIFLDNRSNSTAAKFKWKNKSNFLSIKPSFGQLEPGETRLIEIQYCAMVNSSSAFHHLECYCDIISMKELEKYLNDLAKWEKEKKRQEEEFTIDDMKHRPQQVKLVDPQRDPKPKSKTLPPLERGKHNRRGENVWIKPSVPKPHQLQLTINAHPRPRVDFLEKFPNQFEYYFMTSLETTEASVVEKIECSSEESRLMKIVVGNILRTLLDDTYMMQLIKDQPDEKPYYYAQLNGANWPPEGNRTESPNRLIASIMEMDDSDPIAVSRKDDTDDDKRDEVKSLEEILSGMLRNIISSASSGETILTAKPLNITN